MDRDAFDALRHQYVLLITALAALLLLAACGEEATPPTATNQ